MIAKLKTWLNDNQNCFPGWVAKTLMAVFTWGVAYWSIGEMYHEGWWGAWTNPAIYTIPLIVFLALTLVSLYWPKVGGAIIIAFGVFAGFFFDMIPFGVVIALLGLLYWLEGRRVAQLPEPPKNTRWLWFVLAPTALVVLGFSIVRLPQVLARQDDGDRSARLIEGDGVELIWAPEGPGWNWQQDWGGYPGWDAVALYGMAPVGMDWRSKPDYGRLEDGSYQHATAEDMEQYNVCLYLAEDGLTLLDEPQNIWRMPTVDEMLRSMSLHGENAGCTWQGEYKVQVGCEIEPDKESPLWATDRSPIYYWAADEYDEERGYFVSYNGFVNATLKNSGNPRHSYRCVRDAAGIDD